MVDNIKSTLIYKENCDYNQSTLKTELPILEKQIDIQILHQNLYLNDGKQRDNSPGHENEIYYGETLKIDINVNFLPENSPVKYGLIYLYYFNSYTRKIEDVGFKELNKNGEASFLHMPKYDGYYYASYKNIDKKFFEEKSSSNYYITLKNIPTKTIIQNKKQIIDAKESIELTAIVTDIYNRPVKYGVLSFLSYREHSFSGPYAGIGLPVSDPIPLNEEGKAILEYSPIQHSNKIGVFYYDERTTDFYYIHDEDEAFVLYDNNNGDFYYDSNICKNITFNYYETETKDAEIGDFFITYSGDFNSNEMLEIIKGQYNFSEPQYTNKKFKYFNTSNSYTTINLIQPSILSVTLETDKGEDLDFDERTGLYEINGATKIILKCSMFDANKRIIKFYQNFEPEFEIVIEGETDEGDIIKKSIDGFIDTDSYIQEQYQDNKGITRNIKCGTVITADINNDILFNGFYSIQVFFKGGYGLPGGENGITAEEAGVSVDTDILNFQYYNELKSIQYGVFVKDIIKTCKIKLSFNDEFDSKIALNTDVPINIELLGPDGGPFDWDIVNFFMQNQDLIPEVTLENKTTNEKIPISLELKVIEREGEYIFRLVGEYIFKAEYEGNFIFKATSTQISFDNYFIQSGEEIQPLKLRARKAIKVELNLINKPTGNKYTYGDEVQYEVILSDGYLFDNYKMQAIVSNGENTYIQEFSLNKELPSVRNTFSELENGIWTIDIISQEIQNEPLATLDFEIKKAEIDIIPYGIQAIEDENNNHYVGEILTGNYELGFTINSTNKFKNEEPFKFICSEIDEKIDIYPRNNEEYFVLLNETQLKTVYSPIEKEILIQIEDENNHYCANSESKYYYNDNKFKFDFNFVTVNGVLQERNDNNEEERIIKYINFNLEEKSIQLQIRYTVTNSHTYQIIPAVLVIKNNNKQYGFITFFNKNGLLTKTFPPNIFTIGEWQGDKEYTIYIFTGETFNEEPTRENIYNYLKNEINNEVHIDDYQENIDNEFLDEVIVQYEESNKERFFYTYPNYQQSEYFGDE